jgi:hypothetical protein
MGYFWIRMFDYDPERDGFEKGSLLDEYYLDNVTTREEAKAEVLTHYPHSKVKFAKPKKSSGVYAIVMDSNKFFFDRFYTTIDTHCFWCHKPIKGFARDFPRSQVEDKAGRDEFADGTVYFCEYNCKRHFDNALSPSSEGEFQEKEVGEDGDIFGYIYHIYNRSTNCHYIGQTRYMPFFRWQEHVKDGAKGDISDMVFSVLTEVRRLNSSSNDANQRYLNSMEAWWINKYIKEGFSVLNITKPKITIDQLKQRFDEMVARESQLQLSV